MATSEPAPRDIPQYQQPGPAKAGSKGDQSGSNAGQGQLGVAPPTQGQGAQSWRSDVFQSCDRTPSATTNPTTGVSPSMKNTSWDDYDEDDRR